jgi:hypothetical protein
MVSFSIDLEGDRIPKKKVPLDVLSKIASNLNDLIYEIITNTETLPPKKDIDNFWKIRQVYLTDIGEGSAELKCVQDPQMTLTGINPMIKILNEVQSTLQTIQKTDEKTAKKEFESKFPNELSQVRILSRFKSLLDLKGVSVKLKSDEVGIDCEFKQTYRDRAINWLNNALKHSEVEYKGLIIRIKGDGDERYFTIIDDKNRIMKCNLTPDRESEILELFKTPIILRGVQTQIRASTKISEVIDIKKMETYSINPDDYPPLKSEIIFNLKYNTQDELYIAENEEYLIYEVASNIPELKERLIENIDFLVDQFIILNPPKMSKQMKEAIELFKEIIDPSKRIEEEHWQFEEVE